MMRNSLTGERIKSTKRWVYTANVVDGVVLHTLTDRVDGSTMEFTSVGAAKHWQAVFNDKESDNVVVLAGE